jgi:hypothetical protein
MKKTKVQEKQDETQIKQTWNYERCLGRGDIFLIFPAALLDAQPLPSAP